MNDERNEGLGLESIMLGILALLAAERDERQDDTAKARRTEVILAAAGMSAGEIGKVLGKSRDAVRMTIARAKP